MRRRTFIAGIGGAATWPMVAFALPVMGALAVPGLAQGQQRDKLYRIGIPNTFPPSTWRAFPSSQAFLAGLHDLGYDEGRNLALEFRTTNGDMKRILDVSAEVAALNVNVIFKDTCGVALNAAMQATKTIPIVVAACNDDMVETGIIKSLAHPGGNVTGLNK